MHKHRLLKLSAIAVMLLLTGALVIPWQLSAASALAAPVPGGPKFQMVSAYQFHCATADHSGDYSNDELINNGQEGRFYQAALSLPDNIKINKMIVYFSDNSEQDIIVALWRFDPSNGEHLEMATVSSWGTQGQYLHAADTSVTEPILNQQRYSYYIEVGMPPAGDALRLAAVRIDYSNRSLTR
jgi:hypothetical protein